MFSLSSFLSASCRASLCVLQAPVTRVTHTHTHTHTHSHLHSHSHSHTHTHTHTHSHSHTQSCASFRAVPPSLFQTQGGNRWIPFSFFLLSLCGDDSQS